MRMLPWIGGLIADVGIVAGSGPAPALKGVEIRVVLQQMVVVLGWRMAVGCLKVGGLLQRISGCGVDGRGVDGYGAGVTRSAC